MKRIFFVFGLMSSVVMCASYGPDKQLSQNLHDVINKISIALEPELTRIESQISADADCAQINHVIKEEMKTVVPKLAHVVNCDASKDQRDEFIELLRNLNSLSQFNADDLICAAQAISTSKGRDDMNAAGQKYCPQLSMYNPQSSDAEITAGIKMYEKADLHDPAFNTVKNYMCRASYLSDVALLAQSSDFKPIIVQTCFEQMGKAIALPFVVMNDRFYFYGWEDDFRRSCDVFSLIGEISSELLRAIEQ